MRVLGAVLAGGRSTRFGSDKALALFGGRPLIEHATAFLATQCEAVMIVGRGAVADWPEPGRGPLGGLAGALGHAEAEGFDAVLSGAVDSLMLPPDLLARLSPGPAFVASQPVIGLWPVASLSAAREMLVRGDKASMRAFAERIAGRPVELPLAPANVNTPADLARLENPER